MSSFTRWQQKQLKRTVAQAQLNASFVANGYPSIKITGSNGKEIQAAVVNKQEKDCAYIYTKIDEPLDIGSIWTAKTLHMLVSEEIVVIKDVRWHKYLAFLCNTQIGDWWGYFKGPEKSFINITLKQNVILESQQKPILILPSAAQLDFKDKLVIKNRAWLIQEYDNISTEGITYYSIIPSTVSSSTVENQEVIEKPADVDIPSDDLSLEENIVYFPHNKTIYITTENGYFKVDSDVKIIKHTADQVGFQVPFGITKFNLEYQKEGEKISKVFLSGDNHE